MTEVKAGGRSIGKTQALCVDHAARSWKIDYDELQHLLTKKAEAPAPTDVCHTRGERAAYNQAIMACKSILSNYNKYGSNPMRGQK